MVRFFAVPLPCLFQLDDPETIGEVQPELLVVHVGAKPSFGILGPAASLFPELGWLAAAFVPLLWGGCGLEQKLLCGMRPLAPLIGWVAGLFCKLLAGRFDKQRGKAIRFDGSWRALFPPKGGLHVSGDKERHS